MSNDKLSLLPTDYEKINKRMTIKKLFKLHTTLLKYS